MVVIQLIPKILSFFGSKLLQVKESQQTLSCVTQHATYDVYGAILTYSVAPPKVTPFSLHRFCYAGITLQEGFMSGAAQTLAQILAE